MEKRLTLFFVFLLMSIGAAFAQIDVSGTVISADDNEGSAGGCAGLINSERLRHPLFGGFRRLKTAPFLAQCSARAFPACKLAECS
jgi:hypothetical protein